MDIVENEPKTTWDHTKSEFNGCQELISKNLVDDKDSLLLLLSLGISSSSSSDIHARKNTDIH
jgi:lysophospholipase L1-like esterase